MLPPKSPWAAIGSHGARAAPGAPQTLSLSLTCGGRKALASPLCPQRLANVADSWPGRLAMGSGAFQPEVTALNMALAGSDGESLRPSRCLMACAKWAGRARVSSAVPAAVAQTNVHAGRPR